MSDRQSALWDHEATSFDEAADHGLRDPAIRSAWQQLLLPLLPDHPQQVADLGCGTGTLSVLLAQAGHHVHGVDFSPEMLHVARTKAAGVVPAPQFTEGDAATPPLRAGTFDLVLSRHVLWAMPEPMAALRTWSRLLRPGGQIILIEGNWWTGGGLPATDTLSFLRQLGGDTELHHLQDLALWGKQVTDERYLTITHPARSAVR